MHAAPPAEEPDWSQPPDPALGEIDLSAQAAVFTRAADTGSPICEA